MKLLFTLSALIPVLRVQAEVDYEAYMHEMEAKFVASDHMSDENLFEHMNPDGTGQIKFNEPGRDTMDGGDIHMPNMYKCDGCRILAMFMTNALEKKIDQMPSVKSGKNELDESEVLDIIEDLCQAALRTFKKFV